MGFWSGVGHTFVAVGKGAVRVGLWASKHPEVVAAAAGIAGHPEIAAAVSAAAGVVKRQEPATVTPIAEPTPVAVVVDPQPMAPSEAATSFDEEAAKRVVQTHYKNILNRSRSDITGAEMDEAIDLLRVGREDELIHNLDHRR